MTSVHVPILVKPIVEALVAPFERLRPDSPSHTIVDCTLGGGGHTAAILDALLIVDPARKHRVLALDQDEQALARAKVRFAQEIGEGRIELAHCHFGDALDVIGERSVLGLMADLGFSSDQMNDPERGLSFMSEGPLDMRMDQSRGKSCRDLLFSINEDGIARILSEYGEERFSGRIARNIVEARRAGKMPGTPKELADLIVQAIPPAARFGHQRIHPATRTFQALRIAVNDEMGELDRLLTRVMLSVRPGGRVAILSFHSLEDREVKRALRDREGPFHSLTKKPIEPSEDEVRANPRSRSAKLRIAERK